MGMESCMGGVAGGMGMECCMPGSMGMECCMGEAAATVPTPLHCRLLGSAHGAPPLMVTVMNMPLIACRSTWLRDEVGVEVGGGSGFGG